MIQHNNEIIQSLIKKSAKLQNIHKMWHMYIERISKNYLTCLVGLCRDDREFTITYSVSRTSATPPCSSGIGFCLKCSSISVMLGNHKCWTRHWPAEFFFVVGEKSRKFISIRINKRSMGEKIIVKGWTLKINLK